MLKKVDTSTVATAPTITTYKDHLRIMPVSDTPDRHTIAVSSSLAQRNRRDPHHHHQQRRLHAQQRSHHINYVDDDDLLITPTNSPYRFAGRSHLDPRMTASLPPPTWHQQSAAASSSTTTAVQLLSSCRQSLRFSSAASDVSLTTTVASSSTCGDEHADDTSAAFDAHPSYQKMMDDHLLLDSCNEAQRDMRSTDTTTSAASLTATTAAVIKKPSALLRFKGRPNNSHTTESNENNNDDNDITLRPLSSSSSSSATASMNRQRCVVGTPKNAQRLRQWIGYMHKYVDAIAPRRAEVLRMSTFERRVRLAEQTELREYIASYDRTVKRAAAEVTASGMDDEDAGNAAGGLEERYLALLLQAIEAQCLLEGYPGMRRLTTSATTAIRRRKRCSDYGDDSDDNDEGDVAAEINNSHAHENYKNCTGKTGDVRVVERHVEGCDDDDIDRTPKLLAKNNKRNNDEEVELMEEDVVSSVFSFESADRPCTNLRDEILAVVANETRVAKDVKNSTEVPNVNKTVVDSNADETLVPLLPPLQEQHDLGIETEQAKLTKDMVNRWLQLNLQPAVTSSFWTVQQTQPFHSHSSINTGASSAEPVKLKRLSLQQDSSDAKQTASSFTENTNDANINDTSFNSNTSSSTASNSSNASPKCDDPVWDGFVHELRRSSSTDNRSVVNRPWDYSHIFSVDKLIDEDDVGDNCSAAGDVLAFAIARVDDGNAADAPFADLNNGSEASVLSASSSLRLNDSFLLSGPTRQLTMSTLKRIDDIFDVQHDAPNRVEWVKRSAVTPSTRRIKITKPQSPKVHRRSSPRRAPSGRSHSPSSQPMPVVAATDAIQQLEESLLRKRKRSRRLLARQKAATTTTRSTPDYDRAAAAHSVVTDHAFVKDDEPSRRRHKKFTEKSNIMSSSTEESSSKHQRKSLRLSSQHDNAAVDMRTTANGSQTATVAATTSSSSDTMLDKNMSLSELLENNIAALRPDEVQAIIRLCQTHLECLNHVLLVRTLNTVVGHQTQAANSLLCEQRIAAASVGGPAAAAAAVCRCGPIAHLVQRMVNFVRDYVNVVRNWRLYRLIVAAIAELYGMTRFVSERVRWHRTQMLREQPDEKIMQTKTTEKTSAVVRQSKAPRERATKRKTTTVTSAIEFVL